jgi:hypothetical protein
MNYSFSVTSEVLDYEVETNAPITDTHTLVHIGVGSLELVSYAAREVKGSLLDGQEYKVSLGEVDENDSPGKALVALVADGETVNTVVSARLRKLRKANAPAAE